MTMEQINQTVKDFRQKYALQEPYSQYINGVELNTLDTMQSKRKDTLDLKKNETLDDACIGVLLREEPPEGLGFPSEYKGLRVFYEVTGDITITCHR